MYSIEIARPESVLGIARVHVDCWRECYPFLPEGLHAARSLEVRAQQWRDRIESPNGSQTLILSEVDTIVGFAHVARNGDVDMPGVCAELHACYFRPAFRGTCAGPEMMLRMLGHADCMGWSSFSVWAWKSNPLRRTYAALGLKKVIEREREICDFRAPEVGYLHTDIPQMKRTLERNITLLKRRGDGTRSRRRLATHHLRSC